MNNIKIATFNCRGLNNPNKRAKVFESLKLKNLDVIVLTETNLTTLPKGRKWEREWGGRIIFSYAPTTGSGVVILFNPNFSHTIIKFYSHFSGRIASVHIKFNNYDFKIIGLYLTAHPTRERLDLLETVETLLQGNVDHMVIGDFNFVENIALDKMTVLPPSGGQYGTATMTDIRNNYSLSDVYRHFNPHSIQYTWFNHTKTQASRLDRAYVTKLILNNCFNCSFSPSPYSDHFIFSFFFNPPALGRGRGVWKAHCDVLNDNNFIDLYNDQLDDYIADSSETNPSWPKLKSKTTSMIQANTFLKSRDAKFKISELEKQYNNECKLFPRDANILETISSEIDKIISDRVNINAFKSKVSYDSDFDRPSKHFLRQQKSRAANNDIISLTTEQNTKVTDIQAILTETHHFYTQLYTDPTTHNSAANTFLNNLPQVSQQENILLNRKITALEVTHAIKNSKPGTSPGPDGIPTDFYKKFINQLAPLLANFYNSFLLKNEINPNFLKSIVTLIFKKGDPEYLKNWRPISLMNNDIKFLTKILAKRLSIVTPSLIHPNQTSNIPGRSISDNINLIRNLIDYSNHKQTPALIFSVDQLKAFDKLSHSFLFNVLNSFGFDGNFLSWVRILYKRASGQVLVQGHLTPLSQLIAE